MDVLDRASELLDSGFRPIPLGAVGEEPPKWFIDRYKDDDRESIEKRWTKTPRAAWSQFRGDHDIWSALELILGSAPKHSNLGIVTGQGVVVVDADDDEQIQYVKDNLTYTPYRVRTGKGMHFYYKQPDFEVRNLQFKHGIDFRGVGGYVVAPGSIHHTGVIYTEEVDPVFESFSELPFLTKQDHEKVSGYGKPKENPGTTPTIKSDINFEPVESGSRNNAAAQLTGKMIQQGHSLSTIKQLLDSWNDSLPDPLSSDELNLTVASIARTHTARGGSPIELIGHTVEEPPTSSYGTLEQWGVDRLFADFVDDGDDWTVNHTFERGVAGILAAEGGTGKSLSAIELGVIVAFSKGDVSTETWHGSGVDSTGGVLYVSAEDNMKKCYRRLKKILDERGMTFDDIPELKVIPLPNIRGHHPLMKQEGSELVPTKFFEHIRTELEKHGNMRLVIFDTMQTLVSGEIQNDNAIGQAAMSHANDLAAQMNCTVIFAHHFTKGSSKDDDVFDPEEMKHRIRGGSAIVDGSRFAYVMWKPTKKRARTICEQCDLKYEKGRVVFAGISKENGEEDKSLRILYRHDSGRFENITNRYNEANNDRPARLLLAAIRYAAKEGHPYTVSGEGTAIRDLTHTLPAEIQGMSKHTINELVNRLIEEGSIAKYKVEGSGRQPKWLDAVRSPSINPHYTIKKEGRLMPYDEQNIWAMDE